MKHHEIMWNILLGEKRLTDASLTVDGKCELLQITKG